MANIHLVLALDKLSSNNTLRCLLDNTIKVQCDILEDNMLFISLISMTSMNTIVSLKTK